MSDGVRHDEALRESERPRWSVVVGLLLLLGGGPALVVAAQVVGPPAPSFAQATGSGVADEDLAWFAPTIPFFPYEAGPETWRTLVALPANGGFLLKAGDSWTPYAELDEAPFVAARRPFADEFRASPGEWSDAELLVRAHADAPFAGLREVMDRMAHPELRLWRLGLVVRSGPARSIRRIACYLPAGSAPYAGEVLGVTVDRSGASPVFTAGERTGLTLDELVEWVRVKEANGWGESPLRLRFADDVRWGELAQVFGGLTPAEDAGDTWHNALMWSGGLYVAVE